MLIPGGTLSNLLRRRRRRGGRVGLCITEHGIAVVRLQHEDGLERIRLLEHISCTGWDAALRLLTELVRQYQLADLPCVCVLEPSQYQLHQVDALAVDPTELRSALRWRIRDLIDYHVDDAIVDAFEVPSPRNSNGRNMLFAVSARAQLVQRVVDAVEESGLVLEAVDIPELGLRNIASRVPEQGGGVALVALRESSGLITISLDDTLYLARHLEFGALQLADSPTLLEQSLILEVQRSLDFWESQLSGIPASRVLVAPTTGFRDDLLNRFNEQLGVPSFGLDFGQILELDEPLGEAMQARALFALGGALRRERVAL